MLKHETKLINPGEEQIVETLTLAVNDANKRCRARLLADDPAKWRRFARQATTEPEGHSMFRGGKGGVPATQVLAAWWTDWIGRKHVVVRGRRLEHDETKRMLHKEELDKRPALWHAYPEYVCRRTVGKQSQIVCACGCGAVGTPESLGWMGETCGPCFDRKEELGTAGLSGNFPGVLYSERAPLGEVVCSPDGTRVAATEGSDSVTVWDIPRRTRTVIKFDGGYHTTDVAITSDSKHLLITGSNSYDPNAGLFAAYDLTTDPLTRVDPTNRDTPFCMQVVALPDPELAFLHRVDSGSYQNRVQVIRVPSGDPVHGFNWWNGMYGRLVVSPDGSRFATYGHNLAVYKFGSNRALWEMDYTTSVGTFSHDAARFFALTHNSLSVRDAETGEPLHTTSLAGWRPFNSYPSYINAMVADPAGQFIYASTREGKLMVITADTLTPRAMLEWHLSAIADLAISADGSRVFTSGGDGCVKVWPIRDLLHGV